MNKVFKTTIFFFIVSLSFFFGFNGRIYFENLKYIIISNKQKIFNNKQVSYCPEEISYLPRNSALIIGHAYGSPELSYKRGDVGIAPKIVEFYINNKEKIDVIFFAGDVLNKPSIKKWQKFYASFDEKLKIFIAPGNHDVGGLHFDNALRDVFQIIKHRNQEEKNFPFKVYYDKSLFLIFDTNNHIDIPKDINNLISEEKKIKNIYIIMHHVLPISLRKEANGIRKYGMLKDSIFENSFGKYKDKNIVFIYGDGGVSKFHSRIKCIELGNTKHIVNGIGEFSDDSVLVINKQKIYRMRI